MGYAASMRFSPGDLAVLEATPEVEIETRAADGTLHRTIVWVVVDGTDVFVRCVRGSSGRWYREAVERPDVAIRLDGRRLAAVAVAATDPGSIARTSASLERKYAFDSSMPSMLRAEVLDTTLRLDPA
jgi:hypothetical protein